MDAEYAESGLPRASEWCYGSAILAWRVWAAVVRADKRLRNDPRMDAESGLPRASEWCYSSAILAWRVRAAVVGADKRLRNDPRMDAEDAEWRGAENERLVLQQPDPPLVRAAAWRCEPAVDPRRSA